MIVVQNHAHPARIRDALVDLAALGAVSIQVASAYTTSSGSKMLLDAVRQSVGCTAFSSMPKTLVTSFDYGITEPSVLDDWLSLDNATVHVAGAGAIAEGTMTPARAFHPKIYAFNLDQRTSNVLVASANLTGRGLTVNAEAGWLQRGVESGQVEQAFSRLLDDTQSLSRALLESYRELRGRQPAGKPIMDEARPVVPVDAPGELRPFREAVESEEIDLAEFDIMWVQVRKLQGGSENQLELPRRGHRFFGFDFSDYHAQHNVTIGSPVLRMGSRSWADKPLTWHGNNRMERLNLPTGVQGGPDYVDSTVMFRRLGASFELAVTPLDSDLAHAWTHASRAAGTLFKLGAQATPRLVGLLK